MMSVLCPSLAYERLTNYSRSEGHDELSICVSSVKRSSLAIRYKTSQNDILELIDSMALAKTSNFDSACSTRGFIDILSNMEFCSTLRPWCTIR